MASKGRDPKEQVHDMVAVQVDGCIRNVGGAKIPSEPQLVRFYVHSCGAGGVQLLWQTAELWTQTVSGDQVYGPTTVDSGQQYVLVNNCLANVYDCDPANPPDIVEEDGNWWDVPGTTGAQTRCFRRVTGPSTTNIGEYYGYLKNTSGAILKNRVMRWTHPAGWYVYTRSNNDGWYYAALPANASPYVVEIAGPANTADTLHPARESPFLVHKTTAPVRQDFTRT